MIQRENLRGDDLSGQGNCIDYCSKGVTQEFSQAAFRDLGLTSIVLTPGDSHEFDYRFPDGEIT